MSEVAEQEALREEMEERVVLIKEMTLFENLPQWAVLRSQMKDMIKVRQNIDFQEPINSIDDAFASSRRRAEAKGLAMALALPTTLIEQAELELEHIRARMQEIEDERKSS